MRIPISHPSGWLPTPNGSLDTMASSIAHAINGTLTNPAGLASDDRYGLENSDKWAGTYGQTYTTGNGAWAHPIGTRSESQGDSESSGRIGLDSPNIASLGLPISLLPVSESGTEVNHREIGELGQNWISQPLPPWSP